ncbi:MAG: hypothetical protein ACRDQ0_20580 [Pseudonocardia sp.]
MTGRWSSALSWDTRVVWNERRQRYWWNAWLESTETELSGWADTREEAVRAMQRAVQEARRQPRPRA